jgi:predicted dehydrogenase
VSKPLRVGIVGSGFGGLVHAPAYRAQGRFEVVAIASPNRAADVAKERNIPYAFVSVGEMLAGIDLDVVSVASPPFDHKTSVLAALSHGKHVLCEKPFGLNVAECEEMVAAATRAGTVCAIAHEFRYTPARLAMKELIENKHLGDLREIESVILNRGLRAGNERANTWWFERRCGGGITGAILSHMVDQTTWLAGRLPNRVTGFERTANSVRTYHGKTFTTDVADGAFVLLDYGLGLVGRAIADGTRTVESATLAVHGEKLTAVASGPNVIEATMFAIDEEETSELELKAAKHAKLAAVHPNVPPFVALLDEFASAIDGKPANLPTFADGLATQRVLAAIGYSTESISPS